MLTALARLLGLLTRLLPATLLLLAWLVLPALLLLIGLLLPALLTRILILVHRFLPKASPSGTKRPKGDRVPLFSYELREQTGSIQMKADEFLADECFEGMIIGRSSDMELDCERSKYSIGCEGKHFLLTALLFLVCHTRLYARS